MPVYKLLDEMPYEEFIKWHLYFEARPIGWREDDRTMKLLQAQGVKANPESIFASLAKMANANRAAQPDSSEIHKVSQQNLQGSAFFKNMLGAVGGDKIDGL